MTEIYTVIGENIKTYRNALHMTIDTLAKKIFKSKATVCKYEKGDIAMDVSTLYDIATALGVTCAQLLEQITPQKVALAHSCDPTAVDTTQYLYVYDKRADRILRGLLVGHAKTADDFSMTLFYDVPAFDEPAHCHALYYGGRERHDFVTTYFFVNQSNSVEHVFMCMMQPLSTSVQSFGLISGISSRSLLPMSTKCMLSEAMLPEDDELKERLSLSREDINLTRKYNRLMIEQDGR